MCKKSNKLNAFQNIVVSILWKASQEILRNYDVRMGLEETIRFPIPNQISSCGNELMKVQQRRKIIWPERFCKNFKLWHWQTCTLKNTYILGTTYINIRNHLENNQLILKNVRAFKLWYNWRYSFRYQLSKKIYIYISKKIIRFAPSQVSLPL